MGASDLPPDSARVILQFKRFLIGPLFLYQGVSFRLFCNPERSRL